MESRQPLPLSRRTLPSGPGVPSAQSPTRPEPMMPLPYCTAPVSAETAADAVRVVRQRAGDGVGDDEAGHGGEQKDGNHQSPQSAQSGVRRDARKDSEGQRSHCAVKQNAVIAEAHHQPGIGHVGPP